MLKTFLGLTVEIEIIIIYLFIFFAVGLLLCAVNALCSDGVENPKCGSSWKVKD